MFKKLFNDEAGVSPIVATLVLVVVAIAGAAAVGTIMGSFSSDVSDDASAADATSAASTELLIAGSTTVQPVSEVLAEAYMKDHPGVKITVQGGGSGAGVTSTELDIIDIGSSSSAVDTVNDHPDLQSYQIGGSAVVVIVDKTNTLGFTENTNITKAQLKSIYELADDDGLVGVTLASNNITAVATGTDLTVYQRAEESGTEETFAKYVDLKDSSKQLDSTALGAVGNGGVLSAVESTVNSLGFVDFGYADASDDVIILDVDGYNPTGDTIKAALAGDDGYNPSLIRPLIYLTNGNPSTIEQSYINYAMSPEAIELFHEVGYYSIIEFA
jgi:phosphate transport system substrate-binding protein